MYRGVYAQVRRWGKRERRVGGSARTSLSAVNLRFLPVCREKEKKTKNRCWEKLERKGRQSGLNFYLLFQFRNFFLHLLLFVPSLLLFDLLESCFLRGTFLQHHLPHSILCLQILAQRLYRPHISDTDEDVSTHVHACTRAWLHVFGGVCSEGHEDVALGGLHVHANTCTHTYTGTCRHTCICT